MSDILQLHEDEEVEIIQKNLGKLEDKARMIYLKTYEPTLDEINNIYKVIKQYIRDNDLIIYGGYAQNALIEVKDKNATFYSEYDIPDIEFYTPDPLKDLIDLCDILHKKGFKYVEGSEGVHPETYKIFVNFINYSDFSFMPKKIFDNLPTIKVDGMRMTHPHFMLVDAFRVYVDPMTSYFRLSKTFNRFSVLSYYYPFNENNIYNKIEYSSNIKKELSYEIKTFIIKSILKNMKLIIVGHMAFNRLMKKAEMENEFLVDEPFLMVISSNFIEDRDKIYNILKKEYGKKISYKKYNPYFQFLDKSVEFYYDNQIILRVYGNNERCLVYKYSEKNNLYYGTYQMVFLYLLSTYFLAITRNNNFNQKAYITMISRLIKAKQSYLNKNKINILSNSPFQHFTMECIGDPVDPLREARLKLIKNKEQGKRLKFRYNPTGTPGNPPNYKFYDKSGDLYS